VDGDQRLAGDAERAGIRAGSREVLPQRHDGQQADQADDDDDGLDDTAGDVAERERLALPLDDRPQHDDGADVGDGEEDLAERAQSDALRACVTDPGLGHTT